jgi:ferredoxin
LDDPVTTLFWIMFAFSLLMGAYFVARWRRELGRSRWWSGIEVEGKRVKVGVNQSLCMGAASCVQLAPEVFRLDWSKRKSSFDPAPLERLTDMAPDPDRIFLAAQSCPYRAIYLEDADTGERVFP